MSGGVTPVGQHHLLHRRASFEMASRWSKFLEHLGALEAQRFRIYASEA
jgi:hypothetical protein